MGGSFTTLGGQPRTNLARLNPNGTLDTGFNPGANGGVSSLAVQADGKILVGGNFIVLGGQTRHFIGRLNADGTLDDTFNPNAIADVYAFALQTDGKILAGGRFTTIGWQTRNHIARLNADGTLDSGFNPGANADVFSLALQVDGKILIGGGFTNLAGQARTYLGRLTATGPATQSLSCNGSTITWLRGGTSPEVWRTTFEFSTNGMTWTSLGAGTRIPGGWQLAGVALPAAGTIRGRGYVTGGNNNASSWFVESTLTVGQQARPSIVVNDGTFGMRTNRFGFNVSGTVGQVAVVEGSTNLLNWLPLQTNTLGSGPFYFSDPVTGVFPWRYYRARARP